MSVPYAEAAKGAVKRLLHATAPRWTTAVMSARARAYSQRVARSWGCETLNRKLIDRFGAVVQEGPFAGLVLTPMTFAEHLAPFLLGVYESELDRAWEIVSSGTYPQIVDIGAKFGYYAVGFAKHYPNADVVAFDPDWWARAAMREMALANGVRNVHVKALCERSWLERDLNESALIISDCEGYEATLFDAPVVGALKSATLMIETHDCFTPGVTDTLRARFVGTHSIHLFRDADGRRRSTRPLDFLSDDELRLAEAEVRPEQFWLFCIPHAGPNARLQELAMTTFDSRRAGPRA
jgi:hypothetical protein